MVKNRYVRVGSLLIAGIMAVSCSNKESVTANYQVVPMAQTMSEVSAEVFFSLKDGVKVIYPKGNEKMQRNAEFLAEYVKEQTGIALKLQAGDPEVGAICLVTGVENTNPEAYRLKIGKDQVQIAGASEAGVFYGIQTLRKALSVSADADVRLPEVEISDAPRFGYRGLHLDVSRHFFSVDEVKTYIDMLALHNMNRFHWHLTDDQGWRIEIKKYPKLMSVASQRTGTLVGRWGSEVYDDVVYGGYYTQEQIKDVIDYAAKRYITIIPEVDLPGHMQAALAAYPELGCTGGPYEVRKTWGISDDVLCIGEDKTLEFIKDVLSEVADLFPSEYIHVGGDECPKIRWEKCPKCQARIKALGLKSDGKHTKEQRLQSYVINEAEKFLETKGKRIIGWTEILEGGLSPNATLMSWLGEAGGIEAARQHHDVIMTPTSYLYFDYYQALDTENEPLAIGGYVPIEKVYSYDPVPSVLTPEERQYIKGVQANLWTEYIGTFSQVQYMVMPRMAALSEVQWSDPAKKDYQNFLARMPRLTAIYDCLGWNYAPHIYDVTIDMKPDFEAKGVKVTLLGMPGAEIYYTLDGTEPDKNSLLYKEPFVIKESAVLKATVGKNASSPARNKVKSDTIESHKAFMKPITVLQKNNADFTPNGVGVLVDGRKGSTNRGTGKWVAFQGNDLEAVIDLEEVTEISSVAIRTHINKTDWIFDARGLKMEVSDDGKTFREIASDTYPVMKEADSNDTRLHELAFDTVKTRYVKVTVVSEHSMPEWHGAKGTPAFLFVDEIVLK